ncbi:MFS general substrate transporter [Cutaneotrichosporon oleaginosum]|uniref:Lysosomal dipeptide transporter MFSD1 n=1 Tax=Cutaneotrichosporon oleaginosum TaxID=879819 RepID=A0A0J0XFY0_9TREE|nr:MFS general substrate transporter [Cutaneotrichosporon oleaginosum]KLT39988.1 MFS general substrate transporter [Cutaneotrichosporon oleaginosum]
MPSPLRDILGPRVNRLIIPSETSDLLSNECSTPIRTPPCTPPHERSSYLQSTPSYTPLPRTPVSRLNSPRTTMDPRALSPAAAAPLHRRLSNASLIRSRSVADLREGSGKVDRSRALALIAVCTLSIGSHFLMYVSGPIKSKLHRELGSTNSQFSLMISALNLNSTWTPLVAGILVARYGTAASSLITTGFILLGAVILYAGVASGAIAIMALGYFLFGLGSTPLMVVQETLLARLSPGGHLGLSLALGLVSGKTSSFIASFTSLPLAEAGGDTAPFAVGLALCIISFSANVLRLGLGCGADQTRDAAEVSPKRIVRFDGVSRLGDVFWMYILVNLFCGAIWQPFLHLSANIVQVRFNLSESQASMNASVLMAGAIVLYPIVGWITDRDPGSPRTTFYLFFATSVLTLFCYIFLALPVSLTGTPWPGLISWALGHGASTLLLVVMIPRIMPVALVPLGLGLHKALETAASSASQTLAGLWLDYAKERRGESGAAEGLLLIYAAINAVQLISSIALWRFERRRRLAAKHAAWEEYAEYEELPMEDDDGLTSDEDEPLVEDPRARAIAAKIKEDGPQSGLARSEAERKRGRKFFFCGLGFIGCVWTLWIVTAWRKL